jgi:hypothetical protein
MINFFCKVVGRGWIEATLITDDQEVIVAASYLSDAPYLLIIALALLAEEANDETVCLWQDEPGEYRWVFRRQEKYLELKVLKLEGTFSRQSDENAQLVFYGREELTKFVHRVMRELSAIKAEYTTDGYKELWGYEFPSQALNRLSVAIKS